MNGPLPMQRLRTVARSHPGLVRQNNEDAVAELAECSLLVLADGMGGYNAGEVASAIAVKTIPERIRRAWPPDSGSGTEHSLRTESRLLRDAVIVAHHEIRAHANREPQCAGMGTTVVACLVRSDSVSVAHVGDSRLYRVRGNRLERLTRDHSLLEELIERGHYSREEAEQLVRKNIVTRALGVDASIEVEIAEHALQAGDVLLLCSDGLSDMVDDEQMAGVLCAPGTLPDGLDEAADRLVTLALQAGGRDNISLILAHIDGGPGARGDGLMGRIKRLFTPDTPPAP